MGMSALAAETGEPSLVPEEIARPQVDRSAAPLPVYGYGVGSASGMQPASGFVWRKRAPLQYYAAPPAPTYRWFTTGHGCTYDQGRKYGVGYPQLEYFGITNPYGKR
jgi:hypothetical protein